MPQRHLITLDLGDDNRHPAHRARRVFVHFPGLAEFDVHASTNRRWPSDGFKLASAAPSSSLEQPSLFARRAAPAKRALAFGRRVLLLPLQFLHPRADGRKVRPQHALAPPWAL